MLRAYFRIEPPDAARKIREKVTGKLLSLDQALQSCSRRSVAYWTFLSRMAVGRRNVAERAAARA